MAILKVLTNIGLISFSSIVSCNTYSSTECVMYKSH